MFARQCCDLDDHGRDLNGGLDYDRDRNRNQNGFDELYGYMVLFDDFSVVIAI